LVQQHRLPCQGQDQEEVNHVIRYRDHRHSESPGRRTAASKDFLLAGLRRCGALYRRRFTGHDPIERSDVLHSSADAIDEALINEPGTVEGSAERVRDQILSGSQYAHDRVSIPVDGFGDVVFDTTTEIRKEDDDD